MSTIEVERGAGRLSRAILSISVAAAISIVVLVRWQECRVGSGVAANSLAFLLLYGPPLAGLGYGILAMSARLFARHPRVGLLIGLAICAAMGVVVAWELGSPWTTCQPWGA